MADGLNSGARLLLASQSRARRAMLTAAGLEFDVEPAGIDEPAVRSALTGQAGRVEPADMAEVLARAKAEAVSARNPDRLVIGGDQILSLDGELLDKPADLAAARRSLLELRGRAHELHSGVALAIGGRTVWSTTESARLVMRRFSIRFLDRYLEQVGERVCSSVGAYEIEGLGAQLFERIEGDYFTILGLPLLPLLEELRLREAIPS